jgi:hypothetical protein
MRDDLFAELDPKGLRKFALTTGAIIAVLFGALFPWGLGLRYPIWPWAVAGLLALWALAAPGTLKPLYRGWMRLGLLLNAVMSRIVLGLVFYLVILPTGLVMRLGGKDPMRRRFEPEAPSYRQPPSRALQSKHMENPF